MGLGWGGVGDNKGIKGQGGGLGTGARISPDAVLVIKNDDVQMLPVKKGANLSKLIEMVPEIVSKIKIDKENKEKEEVKKEEN